MAFHRRQGGAWTPIANPRRNGNGVVHLAYTVRRRAGNSWVTIYERYTPVVVSANNVNGHIFSPEPAPNFQGMSGSSTANAVNGTGTYTYLWEKLSGSNSISINTYTGKTVIFSASVLKNTEESAVWRVTANDGITSASNNVTVKFHYETDL